MPIPEIQRYRKMQHEPSGSLDKKKYEDMKEQWRREEKFGRPEEAEIHFNELINIIQNIQISPEYLNDKRAVNELGEAKLKAESLLIGALKQAKDYIVARNRSESFKSKAGEYETDEYQQEHIDIDRNRETSHNALISSVQSAVRYIRMRFADIDQEEIDAWEEAENKAGREPVHARRVRFNSNIICPDSYDLNNRKSIEDWAEQMHRSSEIFKRRYM